MRILHKVYAWAFGYFWKPCPVCGKMFGGHEAAACNGLATGDGKSQIVCSDPMCAYEAGALNVMNGHQVVIRKKPAPL